MLSVETVNTYNEIRKTDGVVSADAFGAKSIKEFGDSTPTDRMGFWAQLREAAVCEANAVKSSSAKAKREASKNKLSISALCSKILLSNRLTVKESNFITDISKKRKLTEKQESWLTVIAKSNNVEMKGQVERKVSKLTAINCEHGDLGSLGFAHGSIVKCPCCGEMARVW